MRDSEAVTFGRSTVDRAAHLRKDIAPVAGDPAARTLVMWRGKPLVTRHGDEGALVLVPFGHPILNDADRTPLFLGLDDKTPLFATDISPWQAPDADELAMSQFFDPSVNRHEDAPNDATFEELRAMMASLSAEDAARAATARAVFSWHDSHRFCAKCGEQSQIVAAGWERTCPACKASHFPRTDPVVIVLALHNNSVLLGRSPHWPEGMYSLLAGFVEPGEGIEAASRREVFEEAGVELGQIKYLASQPWPFPTSLMFGTMGYAKAPDITLDPEELDDAKWVTKEQVVTALMGENPELRPARKGSIARFLIERWVADDLD